MAGIATRQNVVVTFDSLDITQYLDSASLDMTVEQVDTTTLASSGLEISPGMPGFKVPVGGPWAKALDDKLGAQASNPSSTLKTLSVQIGPVGNRVTYTWTSSGTVGAFVGNYKIDFSDPKANFKWDGELAVSGAPTRA